MLFFRGHKENEDKGIGESLEMRSQRVSDDLQAFRLGSIEIPTVDPKIELFVQTINEKFSEKIITLSGNESEVIGKLFWCKCVRVYKTTFVLLALNEIEASKSNSSGLLVDSYPFSYYGRIFHLQNGYKIIHGDEIIEF